VYNVAAAPPERRLRSSPDDGIARDGRRFDTRPRSIHPSRRESRLNPA
jgi:hypothetical protein